MRTLLVASLVLLCAPALAQTNAGPMSGEITAACMTAMDENQSVCACMEDNARTTLSADQQTFLLAIMTEDESLIDDLRGRFTDADAQVVQNQMINAAMQCMG